LGTNYKVAPEMKPTFTFPHLRHFLSRVCWQKFSCRKHSALTRFNT